MFKLWSGDREVSNQADMETLATEFLEELIGTPNQRTCDINLAVLDLPALNLSELRMKSGV
jgi:hypothetical protein